MGPYRRRRVSPMKFFDARIEFRNNGNRRSSASVLQSESRPNRNVYQYRSLKLRDSFSCNSRAVYSLLRPSVFCRHNNKTYRSATQMLESYTIASRAVPYGTRLFYLAYFYIFFPFLFYAFRCFQLRA